MFSSLQTIEMIEKYAAGNYGELPHIVPELGYGPWILDKEGHKFLDFMTSYAVLSFGHRHPRLVRALLDQLNKMPICSRSLPNEPFALFCRDLANFCGMEKVLPAVDGSGAMERAIKIARRWCVTHKKTNSNDGDRCPMVFSFFNNFHGRTYGALSLSTNLHYRSDFGPFMPGFRKLKFGDSDDLIKNAKYYRNALAAIIIEPIQGEGGVLMPPDGYLAEIRRVCDEYNCLMIADEIQTGFGRTGYDLACQHENVKPDIYLFSKALGGGLLPHSAVVTTAKIMGVIGPGDDGNTFGGYPLGSAVASEAIKVLQEERLSENARTAGTYFTEQLKFIRSAHVKEVRGRGLMIGIELENEILAKQAQLELMKNGVLCGLSHAVLRLNPPLIITKQEIDWALPRIEKILKEIG